MKDPMNSTRILISIEQPLHEELVSTVLSQYPQLEVIGPTCNVSEAMAIIERDKPQIWIHSLSDNDDYVAIRTQVQTIAPSLVILHFDASSPGSYLQVPVNTLNELIQFACRLSQTENAYISHP